MGPDLLELYEDGKADDEVAAIIRLGHFEVVPPNVRVVSQFGDIITVRLTRSTLPQISSASEVVGMTAGDTLIGPDLELESAGGPAPSPDTVLPTDQRRPDAQQATGRGVVVGVVDWGFDFAHPDLRHPDGTTRILALWDQRGGKRANSPPPFGYGVVHDRDAIDRALREKDPYAALGYHPADADTGIGCHGTHVTSIAAGTGGADRPTGIAPEADLVLVHNTPWDDAQAGKLGDSVTLLEGIDFIARVAGDRPWVINLSMGCHADQHDGSTLVERGLDTLVRAAAGRAVCMSAGNYFNKRIHASGTLRATEERSFTWSINEKKPTDYNQLQVWYSWQDQFVAVLTSPGGTVTASVKVGERAKLVSGGTELGNVYHRGQEPNTLDNHINIFLYKEAPPGEWTVTLVGSDVIDGRFHAWIEREVGCPPCQSRFVAEDADSRSTTGTICNGRRTIAVGAYDNHDPETRIGPFSSVGPTRDGRLKPDLCAPGVAVLAARSAPRKATEDAPPLTRMSGTSMAAPHVTGTVALMFQVAPRRLRIEETHNLLLESARRVSIPEDNPERIGIGFLDVAAAVAVAQKVGSTNRDFKQITVTVPGAAAVRPPEAPVPARSPPVSTEAASELATASDAASAEGAQEAVPGPCPDVPAAHRQFTRGSVDPAVREAQRKLNVFSLADVAAGGKGLPGTPLNPDCIFGPKTLSAVIAFQERVFPGQGRAHDGIIGPQTWAKLDQVPGSLPQPIPVPPVPPVPPAPKPARCGNVRVWINAFIPRDVPGYTILVPAGPHAGKTAIPCPAIALPVNRHCLSRGYLTDQRSFDPALTAASRMHSEAEIGLVPPALVAHPGREHTTSGTTEIVKATGAVTCVLPADMSRCAFRNFRVELDPAVKGDYFIRLDVKGAASDPCVNLAADIDYVGVISVHCSPSRGVVDVLFDGAVDSFPAFEMYAQLGGVTKNLFVLPPPPGNTVQNLLGGAGTPVSGHVSFDLCDLSAPGAESVMEILAPELVGEGQTWAHAERMESDAEAIVAGVQSPQTGPRVRRPFVEAVLGDALSVPGAGRAATAWEVFDSLSYPGRTRLRASVQEQFELVGAPGVCLQGRVQRGDVLLRRGDRRQVHVAVLGASELVPRTETVARGWSAERADPGGYALVVEGGSRPHSEEDNYARRVTDDAGCIPPGQLLLRPRRNAPGSEGLDPLSLVLGLGIASAGTRPPAPAAAPTVGTDLEYLQEAEPSGQACKARWLADVASYPAEVRRAIENAPSAGHLNLLAWAVLKGIKDPRVLARLAYYALFGDQYGYCEPTTALQRQAWKGIVESVRVYQTRPWPPLVQTGAVACGPRVTKAVADKPAFDITGRYYSLDPTDGTEVYVINQAGNHIEGRVSRVINSESNVSHEDRPTWDLSGDLHGTDFLVFNVTTPSLWYRIRKAGGTLYFDDKVLQPMELRPTLFLGGSSHPLVDPFERHELAPLDPSALSAINALLNPTFMSRILAAFFDTGGEKAQEAALGALHAQVDRDCPPQSRAPHCQRGLEQFHTSDMPLVRLFARRLLTINKWTSARNVTRSQIEWIQIAMDLKAGEGSRDDRDFQTYFGLRVDPKRNVGGGDHLYEVTLTLTGLSVLIAGYTGSITVTKSTGRRYAATFDIDLYGGTVALTLAAFKLGEPFSGVAKSYVEWTENDITGPTNFARASASLGFDTLSGQLGFMHILGNGTLPPLEVFFQDVSLGPPDIDKLRKTASDAQRKKSIGVKDLVDLDVSASVLHGSIDPKRSLTDRLKGNQPPLSNIDLAKHWDNDIAYTRTLSAQTHFCLDSDTLTDEGRQALRILCARELPTLLAPGAQLAVIGHADSLGKSQHNIDLANRRAASTVQAMRDILGKDKFKLNVTSFGMGSALALLESQGKIVAAPKHRRVQIMLNGDVVLTLYGLSP